MRWSGERKAFLEMRYGPYYSNTNLSVPFHVLSIYLTDFVLDVLIALSKL